MRCSPPSGDAVEIDGIMSVATRDSHGRLSAAVGIAEFQGRAKTCFIFASVAQSMCFNQRNIAATSRAGQIPRTRKRKPQSAVLAQVAADETPLQGGLSKSSFGDLNILIIDFDAYA